MKARIYQNIWGNWNGYVGGRRTIEFGLDERAARDWLANQQPPAVSKLEGQIDKLRRQVGRLTRAGIVGDTTTYDEAWTPAELNALETYVATGGLLVLTNTDRRLKYLNVAYDGNEDWPDVNALAQRFGVRFLAGVFGATAATTNGDHPLIRDVASIQMIEDNGHRFTVDHGETIPVVGSSAAAAILTHGTGEVLVLADLGRLGAYEDPPANRRFWTNLGRYAR